MPSPTRSSPATSTAPSSTRPPPSRCPCRTREAPRLLCVEVYESKPLSYLTETAAGLLARTRPTTAVFVPTTTRTREQYRRIHLPGPAPKFAICANGGHLLVDGVSDPDWQRAGRRAGWPTSAPRSPRCAPTSSPPPTPPGCARSGSPRTCSPTSSSSATLLPEGWVKELAAWAEARGWTVSLQGRKIYAVPQPLTKSAAVREVARRTGASPILAAGRLPPRRRPAARRGPRLAPGPRRTGRRGLDGPGITALPERGVAAGERILREFLREVRQARSEREAREGQGPPWWPRRTRTSRRTRLWDFLVLGAPSPAPPRPEQPYAREEQHRQHRRDQHHLRVRRHIAA